MDKYRNVTMKVIDLNNFKKKNGVLKLAAELGWPVNGTDVIQTGEWQVFLYVHDVTSSFTWMGSAELSSFHQVSAAGALLSHDLRQKVVDDLSTILLHVSEKEHVSAGEEELSLMLLLSLYAGGTDSFLSAGRFEKGGHFIAMRYQPKGNKSMLRHFSLPVMEQPCEQVSVEKFNLAIARVIALDKKNHPEWLGYPQKKR